MKLGFSARALPARQASSPPGRRPPFGHFGPPYPTAAIMDSSVIPVDATPLQAGAVEASRTPAANSEGLNPCLECGACCNHYRVSFYCGELAGEHGGWVPVELVTQLGPLRACMRGTEMGHGRCVALRGEVGKPGVSCAIYEQRPSPCREFETWMPDGTPNPDCQKLRVRLGLAPLPVKRVSAPPLEHPDDPDTPLAA